MSDKWSSILHLLKFPHLISIGAFKNEVSRNA